MSDQPANSTSPASQMLPNGYGSPIPQERAEGCVRAAIQCALQVGVPVTIVVTDPAGTAVHLVRMDRAISAGVVVATEKARCAALYKRTTKAFEDAVTSSPAGVRFLALHGVVPVEGGLPLLIDECIVGAIGVSGGTGPQDGIIAKAGADTLAKAAPYLRRRR